MPFIKRVNGSLSNGSLPLIINRHNLFKFVFSGGSGCTQPSRYQNDEKESVFAWYIQDDGLQRYQNPANEAYTSNVCLVASWFIKLC